MQPARIATTDKTNKRDTFLDYVLQIEGQEVYYSCLKDETGEEFHQGSSTTATQVRVYVLILPVWFMVICICILLCLSGLFSGKDLLIHFSEQMKIIWEFLTIYKVN